MTKKEAFDLLDRLETALSNGKVMIHTIQPIDDWAELNIEDKTEETIRHEGYLKGLYDGIEASMGMVEHFHDLVEYGRLSDLQLED